MIKRAAAFVLLVVLGFLLLQWLIGGEDLARAPTPATAADPAPQPQPPDPALRVPGGRQEIEVTLYGPLHLTKRRLRHVGDIDQFDRVYVLDCSDSAPLGDGKQRLVGVKMQLFDRDQQVALLTADEALVELDRDGSGKASVREDKEIELHGAELVTLPGARLAPLRLQLGVVRAHMGTAEVVLHTPSEDEPVVITIAGQHAGTLHGKGLQARLPKDRDGQLQRIDVDVLHDPVLTTAGIELHARGRLKYAEQTDTGAVLVTAADAVRVQFTDTGGPAGGSSAGPIDLHGDRLAAWLMHDAGGEPGTSRMLWRCLRLDGAPAHVHRADVDLDSPTLTVLPGPEGQPFRCTASGGETTLVYVDANHRSSTFTTRRPVHLLQPGAGIGPVYRAFGFPAASLQPLTNLAVVVFDGACDLAPSGARGDAQLHAEQGLWLFKPDARDPDAAVAFRGHGAVRMVIHESGHDTVITGNDGCWLQRAADGELLRLGPSTPAAAAGHLYEIHRGLVEITGTGCAEFDRATADQLVTVHLRSSTPSIGGRFGRELDRIEGATAVDARWRAGELLDLHASGPRPVATFVRGLETITASAPSLWQEATDVFRCEADATTLASVHRLLRDTGGGTSSDLTLTGPLLRVYRLGSKSGVLEAERVGERRVHLQGTTESSNGEPIDLDLDADRVRLLPFAVAPDVLAAHSGAMPAPLRAAATLGMGQPWILADGAVTFRATEARSGSYHGTGHFLALAAGSQSGLLVGDADQQQLATLTRTELDGRRLQVEGPRVQFARGDGEHILVLTTWPGSSASAKPRVTTRDPNRHDEHGLGAVLGICQGEIEVLPDAVLFHGPVRAHSLDDHGNEDPLGMHVDAEHLVLLRDHATHEVTRVEATGRVDLQWSEVRARAREVTIDPRPTHTLCTVIDPDGADIWLRNGWHQRVRQAEVNYRTYSVRVWNGIAQGQPPPTEPRRRP